jgi:hypothetical protein
MMMLLKIKFPFLVFRVAPNWKEKKKSQGKEEGKKSDERTSSILSGFPIFFSSSFPSHLVLKPKIYIKWLFHAGRTGEPKRGRQVQPS